MKILKFYLISSLFFIIGCNSKPSVIILDSPMFVTESVADAGMDSIGFLMRKHVIVVTVKDKNELHVYGAMNGEFKKSINFNIKLQENRTHIVGQILQSYNAHELYSVRYLYQSRLP